MAAASSSARLYFIFSCAVSLWAARLSTSASPPKAAAAPAVDCSSLVLTMADCLSFVSNGSTAEKPEGTCCSGLKSVLKTDAECICEAFRSSAQLGVVLNVTKAMALPAACKVSATSATNCALSITPVSSPVADVSAPESSPASDSSTAPSTTVSSNDEVSTPAPAPVKGLSDASGIVSSFGWLISSAALVSLSLF